MTSREFRDGLLEVYRGEQFGEAVFEVLVDQAENEEQGYILGSLLQFESEGKTRIRPLLARLGLPMSLAADSRAEGHAAVNALAEMSWQEKFAAMAASIRARGLPKYTALEKLVPAEEDQEAHGLAVFLGDHERAILRAAENIASGVARPVAPVVELLHFPLAFRPGPSAGP